jgi:cyclopropane-fatty-acyl-phospholipid synthase
VPFASAFDRIAPWASQQLLSAMGDPPLRIELWDGRGVGPPESEVVGSVRFHDRGVLPLILADAEFQFGELFSAGRLTVEGDLAAVVELGLRGGLDQQGLLTRLLPHRLLAGAIRTDLGRARDNAQHHYDVGNDFYALWLDERMIYTCAYFPEPGASLEEAQVAKMDHVCRKLALRPGQRVLEAGCGWGALALHMARYYGVTVRAYNVAREQILHAREQAEKQGLQDRVEFIEDDYRAAEGRFDAFASVGMLEHVGPDHYAELGEVVARCLEPEGLGLIHSIGRSRPQRLNRWIATRVFPNAHPPTLAEMADIFEPEDFAVLDVENLRRHYELTARHWLARFERNLGPIEDRVGGERARAWRLYLAGTAASFAAATVSLFQVVFTRARNDAVPWTRAHLYTGEPARFASDAEVKRGDL